MRHPSALLAATACVLAAILAATAATAGESPSFVGAWPYGPAGPVTLDPGRNLAFYGSGGVVVTADVSDPAVPTIVSDAIQTGGVAAGIAYDASLRRLYVAADEGGLEIWDVQVPAAPERLGRLSLTYFDVDVPAKGVVVSGNNAYVAADFGYLHQVDVTDPVNPVDVGFYGQGGNPSAGVSIADRSVYVSGPKLTRFLIQPDGSLALTAQNVYTSAGMIVESGDYAYGTNNGDLLVFDATQAGLPVVGSHPFANARDVDVAGNTAYVADATGGVRVLDVTNPTHPTEIGADPTFGTVRLLVSGSYLYATGSNRFRVLDVSVPAAPMETGFRETTSLAYDADVAGGYAYVADAGAGLYVLDVSNAAAPVEVGRADVPGAALDVQVTGSYAYVACQTAGLRIFDVSDPTNPAEIGAQPTPDYARGVFVQGDLAYVADLSAGLRVIDVSDPSAPVELGAVALPPFCNHVQVQGGFAYVANGSAGLSVVDVSNPSSPVQVGAIGSSNYTADVFVQGSIASIADFDGGLRLLDISNPASPVELGSYTPLGLVAGGLFVSAGLAYVMDAGADLRIVDVTNPANPVQIAAYNTPGSAFKVFVAGNNLFIADGVAGVQIVRYGAVTGVPGAGEVATATSRVRLGANLPNPFNPVTEIHYDLPSALPVILTVYDVRGRLVRNLVRAPLQSAGRHAVRWDGRDEHHASVPSGVYLYRLIAGSDSRTRKMHLIR